MLDGELEVMVGENTFRASTGSFVHLPKDIPHAYENVGAGPARFLTLDGAREGGEVLRRGGQTGRRCIFPTTFRTRGHREVLGNCSEVWRGDTTAP